MNKNFYIFLLSTLFISFILFRIFNLRSLSDYLFSLVMHILTLFLHVNNKPGTELLLLIVAFSQVDHLKIYSFFSLSFKSNSSLSFLSMSSRFLCMI